MNIEQYKESGRALYGELANTIASILHQAIVGVSDQPYRFLHIERRAKSLDSHREKLKKNNRLETEQLAVDIKDLAGFRDLLGADVDGVTDAVLTLYRQAETESDRSKLFSLARALAENSLLAWHKAGETGEPYLLTALKALSDAAILPMATELIDELVAGGMVTYSGQLGVVRGKGVSFLQSLYKPTLTNSEKLQVHHALFTATRGVRRPSGSILRDTLLLSANIVRFCIALSREERFEILRTLESKILWLQRNFTTVPANHDDPSILAAYGELSQAITGFRQATTDDRFVIFKTIVGHDSVFPPAWDNDQFEMDGHEAYRLAQLDSYIDLVPKDPDKWFEILRECSASVVEDRTTIGCLRIFLSKIAGW